MTGKGKNNRVSHAKDAQGEDDATKRAIPDYHDRFVRALLSDPEQASALLHDHLPSVITDRLADSLPEVCKDSYIDEALCLSQSEGISIAKCEGGFASRGKRDVYQIGRYTCRVEQT